MTQDLPRTAPDLAAPTDRRRPCRHCGTPSWRCELALCNNCVTQWEIFIRWLEADNPARAARVRRLRELAERQVPLFD